MPNTANFSGTVTVATGINVKSVRYWCFNNWRDFQAAAPQVGNNTATVGEVPLAQAHVVCWDMYSANNQGGTYLGRGLWGNSTQTAGQEFQGMTADQIVAAIYPPPGPDT